MKTQEGVALHSVPWCAAKRFSEGWSPAPARASLGVAMRWVWWCGVVSRSVTDTGPLESVYQIARNQDIPEQALQDALFAASLSVDTADDFLEQRDDVPLRLLDEQTFSENGAFYYLRRAQRGLFATFPYDLFVSGSLLHNGVRRRCDYGRCSLATQPY